MPVTGSCSSRPPSGSPPIEEDRDEHPSLVTPAESTPRGAPLYPDHVPGSLPGSPTNGPAVFHRMWTTQAPCRHVFEFRHRHILGEDLDLADRVWERRLYLRELLDLPLYLEDRVISECCAVLAELCPEAWEAKRGVRGVDSRASTEYLSGSRPSSRATRQGRGGRRRNR